MINHKPYQQFIAVLLTIIMVLGMIPASAVEAVTKESPSIFIEADGGSRSSGTIHWGEGNTEPTDAIVIMSAPTTSGSAISIDSTYTYRVETGKTIDIDAYTLLSRSDYLGSASSWSIGEIDIQPDGVIEVVASVVQNIFNEDFVTIEGRNNGETSFKLSLSNDIETVEITVHISVSSDYWDGTGGRILNNGDTVYFAVDPDDSTTRDGQLTIASDARVTINNDLGYTPIGFYNQHSIGDGATIKFTGSDPYLPIEIDARGKLLTLEALESKTISSILTTETSYNYDDGSLSVSTDNVAESITLKGSGEKGFTINDTLAAQNLIIDGGNHTIHPSSYSGSWYDGADALILKENGSLNIDGSLTLHGCPMGSAYSPNALDGSDNFISGKGLVAESNADIRITAGSSLKIYGGDEHDASEGEGELNWFRGGAASSGDIEITFASVSEGQPSTLIIQNGKDFTGDGATGSSGNVTVNKPAGAYLAGSNWLYEMGKEAYEAACASSEAELLTVKPPVIQEEDGECAPASFILSTDTPDVITFTAVEYGGKAGTKDSQGIELTFNLEISNLPIESISLTGATAGTPVQVSGNNAKWRIPVSDIGFGISTVTIAIAAWGDYTVVTGVQNVTLYRSVTETRSFTAEQYGGKDGKGDTSAILLAFNERVDNLTYGQITLVGAEKSYSDSEYLIPYDNYEAIYGYGGGFYTQWLLIIEADSFANNTKAKITLADWEGGNSLYDVDNSEGEVTLYRETRTPLTYTAVQVGGESNVSDSTGIKLTFDKDVEGLTADQITLINARVASVTGSGKVWTVNFEEGSLTAANGATVTITIENWANYRVDDSSKELVVYAKNREVGFSLYQIGGIYSYGWTKGILLRFSQSVPDPSHVFTIEGVEVGEMTDYGDEDGRTWYLPITNFNFTNGTRVKVTIDELEGLTLTNNENSISIYKDDYSIQVKFTVDQVGGEDGTATTTALHIKAYNAYTGVEVPIPYSADLNIAGASITGRNTVANVEGTRVSINGDWENGDELTLRFPASWRFQGGTVYYETYLDADTGLGMTATTTVYKDTRTHVKLKEIQSQVNGVGIWSNRRDSTEIRFKLDKEVEGLTADKITLTGAKKGELTRDDEGYWYLGISDIEGAYCTLAFEEWDNYHMPERTSLYLSYDNRSYIALKSAVQVGGVSGEEDSGGILLSFHGVVKDTSDMVLRAKTNNGSVELDNWSKQWVRIDGEAYLQIGLENHSYTDGTIFTVSIADAGFNNRIDSNYTNGVEVKLYRAPKQPNSNVGVGYRGLSGVAPYSIDVNSLRKEITLLGQLFGTIHNIDQIHIREKKALIEAGWHTIYTEGREGKVDTALTLDVSELEMFEKIGTYEVRYQSSDGFRSEWRPIYIVDNDVYSQDGYGVLAITQANDGKLTIKPFEGDRDMKADLGSTEPILTFRGGILAPGDDHPYYRVQSGTVINKVLTYYDMQGIKGDTALKVIEKDNGDISIATAEGALYWKNVPITASLTTLGASTFDMSLYTDKSYTTDRLASYTSGGDPVEINTGNEFEVNFLGSFEANMSAYKLYGNEVAISGGVSLQFPKGLETVGISIDEEDMGARLKMEKLILDTTYRSVPGMLANGYIHFNPANMLGKSFGELLGSANLDINVDTLPETENWTIKAKGDLEIAELIYVRGEMVLEWGKVGGYYIMLPEDLEFFARLEGEGMGIPLVPPVIVAYMNGIGGSIKGIGSMIRWISGHGYNKTFVPPGEISLSGAIKDATGEIFSIDEAAITLGVGSFSSYTKEATLLKFIGLEDVGYGFGVRNSTIPNIVDVPGIDVYFNMGGKLYLKEINHVDLGGGFNLSASVYGSKLVDALYEWMKDVKKKGHYVAPSNVVKNNLYDSFDIDGRVYAYGYIVSKLFGRIAGAEGTLAANKTRISGSVRGKLGPLEKDVQVTYYTEDNKFKVKIFSLSDIDDKNDDVEVVLTNVHMNGSYRPGTSDTGYEDGKLRLFTTGFGTRDIPAAKKDDIAVIYADEKYVEIEVWKDDEWIETLDMDDIVIWSDNETEDMEAGKYIAYYEIPADGSYIFKADDKELAYNLIEITPLPGFDTVTALISNERAVVSSWNLNDLATGSGKILYTRLLLMDAETGEVVLNLNPEGTDGSEYLLASDGTHTVYLPETFGGGTYYVSAELIEMDEDGYIVLDIMNSDNIEYTNPDALLAPGNVRVDLIGNGAFTASWDAVSDADGYRITILDEDGNTIPGISLLESDTNSISILGGMNVSSGNQYTGLEYDKTYRIKVQAYQNREYSIKGVSSSEDESYTIPIIGKAYITEGFRIPAPQIPDLYVSVDGANYIENSKEGVSYFATNKSEPSLTIRAEYTADIKVYIGDMEEASHTANNVTNITIPLSNLEGDGIYEIRITAKTESGDYSETGVTISLDTLAPVLHVDSESFYAQDDGKAWVTGFTELGASVTLNGEPLTVDGGLFEYEGDIDGNVMQVRLIAYDDAGNTTERIFSIINAISNAADVLELTTIRDAVINENEITAAVGSSTSSIDINVTVSNGATWKLYSDAGCAKEIVGKAMKLARGINTAYIKVTAEDKVTNKLYSLEITRAGGGGGTPGGGSSSSTPEVLKPLIPGEKQLETMTTATVDIKGSVKNKVLVATITEKMVKNAIKAAQEAAEKSGKEIEGISLDFNITSSKNHTGLSISMDEGAIKLLKEAGVKLIKIGSSILDIRIDAETIAEIEKQSTGRVHISATVQTKLSEEAEELIGSRPVFDISVSYERDEKADDADKVDDVDKADKTGNSDDADKVDKSSKSDKTDKEDKTDNKRYITDFGKGAIILGIAYELAEDEVAGSLYGVYVDKEGKPQLLTRSAYEDGRLIFRRNSLSTYGVGYKTPETVYTDIADHWAKESIEYMVSRELMTGSDEEEFSPDSPLTRRELAEALGRLAGVDVKEYKSRSLIDVKSKENYASYIEWAYKEDIIKASGTSKKRFYPDKEVTREELAEILVSYAKATDYILPVIREAVSYADMYSIGVQYREAVTGLQQAGIMMGKVDNKQTPKAKVTRAELSAILYRYIKLTIDVGTAQGWAINDEGQYLYYKEGKAVTGEETIDDIKHSFDKNGVFEAGWRKKDKDTYYYLSNKPHMGWLTIAADEKKETYYFDEEGIMVFGKWLKIEDKMYYFYEDGRLKL